jgi:hypothetical protein
VRLAQQDDVNVIERSNQGPDNSVNACDFVRQTHGRRRRGLERLSTNERFIREAHDQQAGPGDGHQSDHSQDDVLCGK